MGFLTPDTKLTLDSVDDGSLYYAMLSGNSDDVISDTIARRRVIIDQMEKLVKLYKANQPIYARIHSGARAGSIVRIARSSISLAKVKSGDPSPFGGRQAIQEGMLQSDPRILVKILKDDNAFDTFMLGTYRTYLWVGFHEYLKFARGQDHHYNGGILFYEFDGRKPVKTSFTDQSGLELLPDYQGPTVFEFARKDPVSAAEKAMRVKALNFTPIDRFGHKLKVDDLFIYGKPNDLVFGRLVRVSEKGVISCKDFMTGAEVALMAEDTKRCVKKGLPISALMRFEKDEVLSQKLMVEKLKR